MSTEHQQDTFYPMMAIGDGLVQQLLSGVSEEHAKVMLQDLNTDGFKLLVQLVGHIGGQAILGVASQETGHDVRQLQHTRVQMITLTSVFKALGDNVQAFAQGSHPLSQAKAETDGAL